ncbi:MAG: mechanosensitive ion channel family protein [Proteobacteria bacterium]|nr:mechanosensitive ion channel family protein [Pseudomonadota bacterium]MBU1688425.1 mechanosensitive ion channel family protein [Pseudomonadota bacterium]
MSITEISSHFQVVQDTLFFQRVFVLFCYLLLAKVVDLFIDRVLLRLAQRTRVTFDDMLIDIVHTPICWSIILFGLLHGMAIQPLAAPWGMVLPSLVKSLLLILGMMVLVRFFNNIVEKYLASEVHNGRIARELLLLFKNLIRVVFVVLGLLWLLSIWEIDLRPLFASAGIAGIAVALAAKDTLANFFGGISIFMDNTYKLGDYIILDNQDRGEVVEIGIRSTRIKTRDDVLITVPNSLMANSKIINESAPFPRFRIRIAVGVAYGSNIDQVEQVLLDVARSNPAVSQEPDPRVRLRAFADSALQFELLCWVDDPSVKGRETHILLKAAYAAFRENGIQIPFPQRVVHLNVDKDQGGNSSPAEETVLMATGHSRGPGSSGNDSYS